MQVEAVGGSFKHAASHVLHDGNGLDVQVADHGIALPAAEESDHVGVHSGTQEGHGPTGPEGTGVHIIAGDAILGAEEAGRGLEVRGNCPRGDHTGLAPNGSVVVTHGSSGVGRVLTDVQYASSNGTDWAEEWVIGRAVAYLLPTDGVLLGRESELAKGSSQELLL